MPKESRQNLNILKTKRAFKTKLKAIFINFQGLSLKHIIKNFFGKWEPDFNETGFMSGKKKTLNLKSSYLRYLKEKNHGIWHVNLNMVFP